jgi:pantetheine-phosphate adenylyltransferase
MPRLRKVAVGGTFDPLHRGHLALLDAAFSLGEEVVIGLTTGEMLQKGGIRPYEERRRDLVSFLERRFSGRRYAIVPLRDPHGPAAEDRDLQGIIVSEETRRRGEEINEARKKKGLPPLEVVVLPLVLARDGKPISSTRIRRGEIDPEGRLRGG